MITKKNDDIINYKIKSDFVRIVGEINPIDKNPVRPKDLGIGDDQRLLSIGLVSGVFR